MSKSDATYHNDTHLLSLSCFNHINTPKIYDFLHSFTLLLSHWTRNVKYRFQAQRDILYSALRTANTKPMMSSCEITFSLIQRSWFKSHYFSFLWTHITWIHFALRHQFITLEHRNVCFLFSSSAFPCSAMKTTSWKCKRINNGCRFFFETRLTKFFLQIGINRQNSLHVSHSNISWGRLKGLMENMSSMEWSIEWTIRFIKK